MANATSTQLQELYVAYFGRAADPTGLDYWTSKGISTAKFAADMYAQNEFKSVYGSLSTESQVNQIYKNLFDRTADAAGLSYWTQEINLGNLQLAEIATHLIWAAQNNSGSEDDKTALSNKTSAAVAYTAEVKSTAAGILAYQALSTSPWSAGDNITEAVNYLKGIDKDTAHTAAGITTSVAVITGNGVPAEVKSFELTTGIDTFTGGDAGDTFAGDNSVNTKTSASDTIDGGAGVDTFKLYSRGGAAYQVIPTLSNVEKLEIHDADVAFDASGVTGLTHLDIFRGEGDDTYTVTDGVSVSINNQVVGTGADNAKTTIAFTATQTSANITFDKVTAKGTDANEDVALTGAKIATVNATASGTKSEFDAFDVAAATAVNLTANVAFKAPIETTGTKGTITVTGAGKATLDAIATGFTTLNAGGNSGGLVAQIGSGNDLVLTGSTGNDTITANITDALTSSHKLAVNAGAGTDTLVILEDGDVNTAADAARYTGFEKVVLSETQNLDTLSDDITAVQLDAATSGIFTGLSATQAANVTIAEDQSSAVTISGRSTNGSSDVLTLDLKHDTATTHVAVASGTFSGWETININAATGTDGSTDSSVVFGAAADTTAINLTGTHDFTATLTSTSSDGVAFTSTSTGDVAVTGNVAKTSTITTGSGGDAVTMSTVTGSTYNTGAGNDTITTLFADLAATGEDDHTINAGAGTDTISISDNAADEAIIDTYWTNVTGLEKITLNNDSHDVSMTTGGAFATAFATGAEVTYAAQVDGTFFTLNAGLYTKDFKFTLTSAAIGSGANEDFNFTTGSGDDTLSLTMDSYLGAGGASSGITIDTKAGDDTVTLTSGQLAVMTGSQYLALNTGTGADTVTLDTTRNGAAALATAIITIDAGDSLETSRDKITGFELGDTTNFCDTLDFTGTSTVGTLGTSTDYGVIKSHSVGTGVAKFDDAATYATELIVNANNLTDVLGYLEANSDALETFAFAYDSTGNGSNDAMMVWNNGATTNSLVELAGVTTVEGLVTSNATTENGICLA